jgi:hypothetical protein
VRIVSGTDVTDAPSGFRAISREVAFTLNVFNEYTYTLETIIQAGQKNLTVVSVPIRVNGDLRPSRLVRSIPSYVRRSIITMCRIFIVYKPLRFFLTVSILPLLLGSVIGVRFLVYFFGGNGTGHVQSLILAAVALIVGFLIFLLAIIADLLSVNRRLLEELQQKERRRGVAEKAAKLSASAPTRVERERAEVSQAH